MKEHLYKNIWDYCEKQYPAPARLLRPLRVLLFLFGLYYLLMCFAYLFAMHLAFQYEGVDFVTSGQAVNLFIVMAMSVLAEVAGCICALRKIYFAGALLSLATALFSPFALWNANINTVFKVHHLISMILLLFAQVAFWTLSKYRKKYITAAYNRLVEKALAPHRKAGVLLSRNETEEILKNFDPAAPVTNKPLKRSQKNRIRKQRQE